MPNMKKLIIEVALNEYVRKSEHPDVPLSVGEIADQAAECVAAGAAIVHFHPRPADPGEKFYSLAEDVDAYQEIMKAIADRCDVITYPTYAGVRTQDSNLPLFPHVRALRESGLVPLETFVPFIGATNFGRWSKEEGVWVQDQIDALPHVAMTEFLSWCRDSGLRPQFGVREIGHLRHIAAYRELGLVDSPVVLHLCLSTAFPWGLPPDVTGLMGLLSFIPREWNAEWFIQNNHDSWNAAPSDEERHRLLNVLAICMNGHARTGIGDLPSWGMPQLRNVEMVSKLVEVAETIGRDIATPNEAREMLGLN